MLFHVSAIIRQQRLLEENPIQRLCILALLAILTLHAFAGTTGDGDIAVVVRPDTQADNLSIGEIRKLPPLPPSV